MQKKNIENFLARFEQLKTERELMSKQLAAAREYVRREVTEHAAIWLESTKQPKGELKAAARDQAKLHDLRLPTMRTRNRKSVAGVANRSHYRKLQCAGRSLGLQVLF
jgi:hypothetical protein